LWPTFLAHAGMSLRVPGSLDLISSTSPIFTWPIHFLASRRGPGHVFPRASTTLAIAIFVKSVFIVTHFHENSCFTPMQIKVQLACHSGVCGIALPEKFNIVKNIRSIQVRIRAGFYLIRHIFFVETVVDKC